MHAWNRKLWRTASQLHATYDAARRSDGDFALPEEGWLDAGRLLQHVSIAEAHGWTAAARRTRETLIVDLERLGYRLQDLIAHFKTVGRATCPAIRTLYDELRATEAEFNGLEIEDGALSVTTEPIELEGIGFGPFSIRLDIDRLGYDSPYSIIALEPNPAASSSETTHPHVNGGGLCPGEGRGAIAAALAEGRLFDFFTVVDRILHTYAAGAAYVELSRWNGVSCHDCDCTTDEDDLFSCEACQERVCSDCLVSCDNCGDGHCSDCINRCPQCEERCCGRCLSDCIRCRREVCTSCLDDHVCTSCLEDIEREAQQVEETPKTTIVPAESSL